MASEINKETIAKKPESSGSGASAYLMVPIFIFFVLLIFAVIRGPGLISSAGIGSAIIVVAPLVLATYALTIIVMAGRAGVDLSIGPLIGFINVGLIQLVGVGFMDSPIAVFLYAMGVGIAYQVIIGLIIVFVRVQPIIVSLSGYLALVGLNLMIMPRPGGLAPEWMLEWGAGTTIFSPVLAILVVATIGWYVLARTAFFGNLRMMGSDERATYTSGVNISLVRLGAHAIGGIYAGLAALTFTSLISSGDPTQGTTYTLMAVTALVLGGANLAGGRGSAFGSLLGALNIFLITYALSTFNFGNVQSFVTDLAYGVMLVVSLLISVALPEIQRRAKNLSPVMFFVILATIALGVIMHVALDKLVEPAAAVESAMTSFASFGQEETVAAAAGDSYSGGTYFLFIIIGVFVTAYVFRTLFKYSSAHMIGLVGILVLTALGLIFNPEISEDEVVDAASPTLHSDAGIDAVGFFALEKLSKHSDAFFSVDALAQSTILLITVIGVVLLASLLILAAMPQVSTRVKRNALLMFGIVVVIIAIAALFFQGADQDYLLSNYPVEIFAVLLVGALLFTITIPMVQTRIDNISNWFIAAIAVLAVTAVYFFAGKSEIPNDAAMEYAQPVIVTQGGINPDDSSRSVTSIEVEYAAPTRVNVGKSNLAVYAELGYIGFIIVIFQIFVRIAMGATSFRSFWRYWYIPTFAGVMWGTLFYATGVPLWKIVAVIAVAIISAPNVMHIIGTYLVEQRDGNTGVGVAGQ